MNISLVIPTYNNLRHIKNAYASIRRHYPKVELVLLDDSSTDDTKTWLEALDDGNVIKYRSEDRVGHTILYDKGIDLATNEVVGILHADMLVGPMYLENTLKHLERGKVVCGTRVEPPLHPEGKEKVIRNFGMDFDDLNVEAFEKFVVEEQLLTKDQTTKGIFAPWVLYKEDFQAIGGHDPLFAPFGYEDSDIFNRWILNGYKMIQSRDAFVYHLTCRGHRWSKGVGVENSDYQEIMERCRKDYLRKWGSWIVNDEYQHPIIFPKYDIGIIVNGEASLLELLEPWCSTIYIKGDYSEYITKEQPNTLYNLKERIKPFDNEKNNEILIEVDQSTFTQQDYQIIQQLTQIIQQQGQPGRFQLGNMVTEIVQMNEYQNTLINI